MLNRPSLVGKYAPDFSLSYFVNSSGAPSRLSELRGTPALLIFLSQSSRFSQLQLNQLEEVYKRYQDLAVVGVSMDKDQESLKRLAREKNITYSAFFKASEVFKKYEVNGVPDVYFIDRSGKIKYRITGYKSGSQDDITKKIENILESQQETRSKENR